MCFFKLSFIQSLSYQIQLYKELSSVIWYPLHAIYILTLKVIEGRGQTIF